MRELSSAICLSFILAVGCARGQDLKAAQACTRLGDDVARLSCYDAAFGVSKPPAAQHSGVGNASTLARFGDSGALHPDSQTHLPKSITVHVQQATPLAYGLYRLTLDNGQVWRTTEGNSALEFKANDTVTISRRVMGGYEVSLAGRNASVNATRIK
ncbi:MAG: hypothetical protein WA803_11080 [Steroidobacteraceae bacterium]